jgi:starch phosphorylase
MRELFDRYLGPRWSRDPQDSSLWEAVEKIPADVLWRTHEGQRQRLVSYVRGRLRSQLEATNATTVEIGAVNEILDGGALTIGFARRFAPYKRGNLILRDADRLLGILRDTKRPVQFILAGKSHPRDDAGKKLIQEMVHFAREQNVRSRLVFVENYDMDVATHLVHGVDIWLNNPRRPLEASGTSGMKAAANGALNFSVLDGWWDEAAGEHVGWSIGNGEVYDDPEVQDDVESGAIYDLLEHEIIPLFYDRGRDGLPREWIRMMREAISTLAPVFTTNRMVAEYAERFYFPASARAARLQADGWRGARDLAAWHARIAQAWDGIHIQEIDSEPASERPVGQSVPVRARVALSGLTPAELEVQLYHGAIGPDGNITEAETTPMVPEGDVSDGGAWFRGEVPTTRTGHRGFAVRVLPHHPDQASPFRPGLVRWSSDPVGDGKREPVPV